MATSTHRLKVGLVGPGRRSRFHLQRLCLRTDLLPVAVVAEVPGGEPVGESAGCREVADAGELLSDEGIDLVLVTGTDLLREDTVRRVIELGRPVAVPSPVSEAELEWVSGTRAGARLLVLSNCLADDDFQSALALVSSGRLGQPRTLSHSTWGFIGGDSIGAEEPGSGLPTSVLDRLEQLLMLAGIDPLSVSARHLAGAGRWQGIGITVRFPDGMTAGLEYHPSSPVPLATGWVIAGSDTGYRDFELFTVTDDEEVYGTPLESPAIDLDRVYDDLLLQWDDLAHNTAVLKRAGCLLRLIDAVGASLSRGSEVEVQA
jgi:predicted dehydrogenase